MNSTGEGKVLDDLVYVIKAKRLQEGLSIRQMAKKVGMGWSTLARLERGGSPDQGTRDRLRLWLERGIVMPPRMRAVSWQESIEERLQRLEQAVLPKAEG